MFEKLTIEDNVNECDAYHAAREHFYSLEPEDICFDCCEYSENCECLQNSTKWGLTMIDSFGAALPYIIAVPAGLFLLVWLDEKGWL